MVIQCSNTFTSNSEGRDRTNGRANVADRDEQDDCEGPSPLSTCSMVQDLIFVRMLLIKPAIEYARLAICTRLVLVPQ